MTNGKKREHGHSGAGALYLASSPELEWYIEPDVAARDVIGYIEGDVAVLEA